MHPKIIQPTDAIFSAVLDLRYRLFFADSEQPIEFSADKYEESSTHIAIIDESNELIAYGRLTGRGSQTAIISQMVVQPAHQRQGFGRQIMGSLVAEAEAQQFSAIELAARQEAVPFYTKLGFRPISPTFPSQITGHPHVQMRIDFPINQDDIT